MEMDAQIGRNLARLRGELSQQDLAGRMRERGWKWSQATVWSIEKGERPLRLAEARAVADIVLKPLDLLLWTDGASEIMARQQAVKRASDEVTEAMDRLAHAQMELAIAADAHSEEMSDRWKDIVRDWLRRNGATFDEEARMLARESEAVEQVRMGMTQEELRAEQERSREGLEFVTEFERSR
ncbi:helix-turn-helix transcriptional regulator [Agrococcus sp. DT81.2]|uniref:helix-turn-helix transcriptional regulator n=1 Tax=Agrococcus sp. DT81.2 TaxID=3393414 RepID=UPI003CE4A2CC